MPANIAKVQLSDTFNQWITQSNTTIDEVNTLLNGSFEKSGGTFTANGDVTVTSNGRLYINKTDGVTLTNQGNTQFQKNLQLGGVSNVESTLQSARNTATVSANSGSIRIANTINFVNTSTVQVSVTAGIGSNANVSFTSTVTPGGGGTVTQIETGTGLTGGPITDSGTISANLASTSTVGVVQLIDSVSCTSVVLASTANAVRAAHAKGNTAHDQANAAYTQANTSYTQANAAYTQANTSYTQANAAYTQANTAYARANQAFGNVTTRTTTSGVAYYNDTNNVASASGVTYDSNHGGGLKFSGVTYDTPIISISGDASYADNAAGKVILVACTSAVTVTFDTATNSGFAVTVVRTGTGNVIIANTTGVTKVNSASFTTSNIAAQYEAATVVYTGTNQILVLGSIL